MTPTVKITVKDDRLDVHPGRLEVPGEPYDMKIEVVWETTRWSEVRLENFRRLDKEPVSVDPGPPFSFSANGQVGIRLATSIGIVVTGLLCEYDIVLEEKDEKGQTTNSFILDPEIEFKPLYLNP